MEGQLLAFQPRQLDPHLSVKWHLLKIILCEGESTCSGFHMAKVTTWNHIEASLMVPIGPKDPKMVANGRKWSQMVPNSPTWSQRSQNGPK